MALAYLVPWDIVVFDVVLGIDGLSGHYAQVESGETVVVYCRPGCSEVYFTGVQHRCDMH